MIQRVLMRGNHAVAEAAIRAGCRYFFGYPITPQTELVEYMSRRLPEVGGVFLQAESEIAAINMAYGAAGAGGRVMTSSSGPGMSLKQEGISYLASAEIPCVIAAIMRGGPGLGNIHPAQSDYFQLTRGGGHGDYRVVVYAPQDVQEAADLTVKAFDVADRYRTQVIIAMDGMLAQLVEPLTLPSPMAREKAQVVPTTEAPPDRSWATTAEPGRPRRVITSLHLDPTELHEHNCRLAEKYCRMESELTSFEETRCEDADVIIVAYGTAARIAREAIEVLERKRVRAGLFRPITLWPFPSKRIAELSSIAGDFLAVEMSLGQMVEDVRLAVGGRSRVHLYGRTGGLVVSVAEILDELGRIVDIR